MSVRKLFDLSGRVALITGGSRGLGLQIAEALGEMGAKVVITTRKQPELDEAAAHLKSQGVDVTTVACDLQDVKAAKLVVEQVLAKHGRLDVLVNNAGTTWGAPAEQHPLDAWNKVINLNLTAVFALSQAAANLAMIPGNGGRIINVASVAGLSGTHADFMRTIAYNTSKGGVVNFTRSLAAEWARYNITVNAIAPGAVAGDRIDRVIKGQADVRGVDVEKMRQSFVERSPLRRMSTAEDIAALAAFLCSDMARNISGQCIPVTAGEPAS
jgi:NAD(P)-dependent dehydrogenase (short-subunit alcohol dehydrogenase family)